MPAESILVEDCDEQPPLAGWAIPHCGSQCSFRKRAVRLWSLHILLATPWHHTARTTMAISR